MTPPVINRLTGIHAVREALEANRPLDSMMVAKGSHGSRIEDLVRLARQNNVPVRFEERIQLDRTAGTREHQGVVAFVSSSPMANFYDLLKPRPEGSAPGSAAWEAPNKGLACSTDENPDRAEEARAVPLPGIAGTVG